MSALAHIHPDHERALQICESGEQAPRPWPGYEHVPRPAELVDYATVGDTQHDASFAPLKITAHMATAVAGSQQLMLDGPLSFGAYCAFMERHWTDRWYLPRRDCAWPIDFELPVARWVAPAHIPMPHDPRLLTPDGSLWGWCVSAAVVSWAGSSVEYFRGTPPVGHMIRLSSGKSVNLASGEFKAIQLPMETHLPEDMELVWYALGDAQGVRDALRRVCQIGKKSRTGHGALMLDGDGYPMWTVEEVSDGAGWWRGPDERGDLRLRRPMPAGWAGITGGLRLSPIRTPHDHASRRTFCAPAGAPC